MATAFQTALQALNGQADANAATTVFKFAADVTGTPGTYAMTDVGGLTVVAEGTPTVGGVAGPLIADTTGPNKATALNGTTQGFYVDVTNLLSGVTTLGTTLWAWVNGTNKTQQRSVIGFWRSIRYTTGMEISCNTDPVTGLVSTTNEVVLCSARGSEAAGAWDYMLPNIGRCINDSTWNLMVYHARVSGGSMYVKLWVNDSDQPVSRLYAGVGTYTAGTDRVVIGGYSTSGSVRVYNYNDTIGPTGATQGEPTAAQRRAVLKAGTPTVDDTVPRCLVHFRADRNVVGVDEGDITSIASDTTDCEASVTLTPTAGATGGPTLRIAALAGKAAIVADNLYRADYFQTLENLSITSLHPNLLTVAALVRQGAMNPDGVTEQEVLRLAASDNSYLAMSARSSLQALRAATTFQDTTKPLVRTGPGATFVAMTSDLGSTVLYQDGETGFNPSVNPMAQGAVLYTKLYLFGIGALAGQCFDGLLHEIAVFRTAATQAEITSLRSAMLNRWRLGQESTTSDIEVIFGGDSIGQGYDAIDVGGWFNVLATYHMGPRWINRSVSSYTSANVLALGWTAASKAYLGTTPSKSFLMLAASINDIATAVSADDWWTNIAAICTAYRLVRPSGGIIIVGPTPGNAGQLAARQAYQTKALANISTFGGNCRYVSLESLIGVGTYSDGIHPDNVAHAAIAGLIDTTMHNLDPVAFPDDPSLGGGRSRNYRSRNWR